MTRIRWYKLGLIRGEAVKADPWATARARLEEGYHVGLFRVGEPGDPGALSGGADPTQKLQRSRDARRDRGAARGRARVPSRDRRSLADRQSRPVRRRDPQ